MPAVSAHSLLPISTRREQQRAKAKTSSSPVNMELALTTSLERPYYEGRVSSGSGPRMSQTTHEIIHDTAHMSRDFSRLLVWIVGEHFEDRHLGGHKELDLCTGKHVQLLRFTVVTHLVVITRINERNKPPREILFVQPHLRYVEDENRPEVLRDLEIVGRAQRLAAEIVESELGHLARALRDCDRATPGGKLAVADDGVRWVAGSVGMEDLFHLLPIFRRKWVVINVRQRTRYTTIIYGTV
jgi:hypothetical protein